MGEVGSLAALSQGVSGLSSAANGYSQYTAFNAQGRAQRNLSNVNAQMADLQAADAIRRGGKTATLIREQGAQIEGQQRVGLAAGGVDVNSGTAAQIQSDTKTLTEMDALQAQNNAALEALGYKMESTNLTAQGQMARISGRLQGGQSLISGGMGFARDSMMAAALYNKYHIHVPVDTKGPLGKEHLDPEWHLPNNPIGIDQGSGVPSDVG